MDRSLAKLAPRRMLHLPSRTVRLRLTLLYSGLFLVSGVALLAATYLIFRSNGGVDLIVAPRNQGGLHGISQNPEVVRQVHQMYETSVARDRHGLHEGLIQSGIVLAIMTIVSIALGWLVAGRVLRPLRAMTATTRQISERNLNERLALQGPRDELKDLADTVDGLLARLEAHVAEQQRFAANASHELRTPLAITQTLLDVARNDPNRQSGELVDRLHEVNTRAIDLTEALLLLSRAGQRSFATERIDLSLIVEEATEALLPLAETRGVTVETSGETAASIGSHALLLQVTTNLVQNAIVHNLSAEGAAWVMTMLTPRAWSSPSRTPVKSSPHSWSPRSPSHFSAAPNAYAPTTQASAWAWPSSRASPKHTTEPSPSTPEPAGGFVSRCDYPPQACTLLAENQRSRRPATSSSAQPVSSLHNKPPTPSRDAHESQRPSRLLGDRGRVLRA